MAAAAARRAVAAEEAEAHARREEARHAGRDDGREGSREERQEGGREGAPEWGRAQREVEAEEARARRQLVDRRRELSHQKEAKEVAHRRR